MRGTLKLTVQKSSPNGPRVYFMQRARRWKNMVVKGIWGTYWLRELVSRILLLFRWESTEECRLQNGRIFALVKNANTRRTKYFWGWRSRFAGGNSHQEQEITPALRALRTAVWRRKNQLFCSLTPMLRFYQLSWQRKFPAVKKI